jgi:hypothetical protein
VALNENNGDVWRRRTAWHRGRRGIGGVGLYVSVKISTNVK